MRLYSQFRAVAQISVADCLPASDHARNGPNVKPFHFADRGWVAKDHAAQCDTRVAPDRAAQRISGKSASSASICWKLRLIEAFRVLSKNAPNRFDLLREASRMDLDHWHVRPSGSSLHHCITSARTQNQRKTDIERGSTPSRDAKSICPFSMRHSSPDDREAKARAESLRPRRSNSSNTRSESADATRIRHAKCAAVANRSSTVPTSVLGRIGQQVRSQSVHFSRLDVTADSAGSNPTSRMSLGLDGRTRSRDKLMRVL